MFLKKRLGQHFLRDKNLLAKEARLLGVKGKIVLEIGPGDGALTEQLLLAGPKKLLAVEKDPRMATILREKFAGKPIEIVEYDFLELEPIKIDKIAGNIPYYISSQIIFRLKDFEFEDALLMVQDEFARKMVAKSGANNYGRLSVTSQLFYDVKYIQRVDAAMFFPRPKVNSAIILLKKRPISLNQDAENIIRALFQHKNKTVQNALLDAGFGKTAISCLSNFLVRRPRTLSTGEILEVIKLLKNQIIERNKKIKEQASLQ